MSRLVNVVFMATLPVPAVAPADAFPAILAGADWHSDHVGGSPRPPWSRRLLLFSL
jgi:hypothetical protein